MKLQEFRGLGSIGITMFSWTPSPEPFFGGAPAFVYRHKLIN